MVVRQQKHLGDQCLSQMTVYDFFQNLISNTNFLINNTKVLCVPCKSCSKSPNSTQRTFIIYYGHLREKSNEAHRGLPVIEPATSYVGKQEREEESFEVTSSRKPLSRMEHDDFTIKNVSKTQHSRTGDFNLPMKRRKYKKHALFTKNYKTSCNEAAENLRVIVSKLKRIGRTHEISSWPYNKINKNKGVTHSRYSQTCSNTEKLIPKIRESKELATRRPETTKSVKAKFGSNFVRFEIFTSSKMIDLEEILRKRLKLEMGSFTIKYTDEDGDLILITCDADLSLCFKTSGVMPIRMVVSPVINLSPL